VRRYIYVLLMFLIFIPIKSKSAINDDLNCLPKDGFLYIYISEPSIFSSQPEGSKGYFNLMLSDEMNNQLTSINVPMSTDDILQTLKDCHISIGFYIEKDRFPFSAVVSFKKDNPTFNNFSSILDVIIKGVIEFGKNNGARINMIEKANGGFNIRELKYQEEVTNKEYYFATGETCFILSNFRRTFYNTLDNISKGNHPLQLDRGIKDTLEVLGNDGDIYSFFMTEVIKSKKNKSFKKALNEITESDEQIFLTPLSNIIDNSICIGFKNICLSETTGPTDIIACLLKNNKILDNTIYSNENRHENLLLDYLPENIILLMSTPLLEDIGIPQNIIDDSLIFTIYKGDQKIDKLFELKDAQMLILFKKGKRVEDTISFDRTEEYSGTKIYYYSNGIISIIRRAENLDEKEIALYSKDENTIKETTDNIISGKTTDKTRNFNNVLSHLEKNTNLLIYVDTSLYPDILDKENMTPEQRMYALKRALCEIGFGVSVYPKDKFIVLESYPQLLPKLIFLIFSRGH